MDSDQVEKYIQEKNLTAPRVTKDQIDKLVQEFEYHVYRVPNTTTMISVVFLNGFSIATGLSACVDPDNFDEDLGYEIANRNSTNAAIQKLWELEGYALKKQLSQKESHQPSSV